jgi:hypothetical protein
MIADEGVQPDVSSTPHIGWLTRLGPALRRTARHSLWPALLAVAAIVPLAGPPTVIAPARLLATYLITTTQLPPILTLHGPALEATATPYVTFATGNQPPAPVSEVDYPASWFPLSGPFSLTSLRQSLKKGLAALQTDLEGDPDPVVFGYSQGASVITLYKRRFNEQYASPAPGQIVPKPTYVMIGNPNRPNGGMWQAFYPLYIPIIDMPFIGATPTDTAGAQPGEITSYDFVHQYDFFADFPNRPLNLVALVNAAFGALWGHGDYHQISPNDAVLQDQVGDTAYYMLPQRRLPLLKPLQLIGIPDPILAVLDAPLRVLIENGYDRDISPGRPTTASIWPARDLIQLVANLLVSIPTGLDDGLEQVGLGRPFGTTAAGPYGVGGPPVSLPGNGANANVIPEDVKAAIVSKSVEPKPDRRAPAAVPATTTGSEAVESAVTRPAEDEARDVDPAAELMSGVDAAQLDGATEGQSDGTDEAKYDAADTQQSDDPEADADGTDAGQADDADPAQLDGAHADVDRGQSTPTDRNSGHNVGAKGDGENTESSST